jgi:hypothetical protein
MSEVSIAEDSALIQKGAEASFIEIVKTRQVVKAHLVDGKNQNQFGPFYTLLSAGRGQDDRPDQQGNCHTRFFHGSHT